MKFKSTVAPKRDDGLNNLIMKHKIPKCIPFI